MSKKRISSNYITQLAPNEVLCLRKQFERHAWRRCRQTCYREFGAEWGQGIGLFGQTYAIPTMQGDAETIKPYVDVFIEFAKKHNELVFLVTEIGCCIAGFTPQEITPLFSRTITEDIQNKYLPESFYAAIEPLK